MNDWKCFSAAARGRMLAAVATTALTAALGPASALAQDTGSSIFGWAPAGQTVTVEGLTSGTRRHATVKDSGHYSVSRLPLGTYQVTLEKDGKPVETRSNINLKVGRGAEVDFACPQDHCEKRGEG